MRTDLLPRDLAGYYPVGAWGSSLCLLRVLSSLALAYISLGRRGLSLWDTRLGFASSW